MSGYPIEFKPLETNDESQRFYESLKSESNNRIIFSGIFGIGKSFFLNKFFYKDYKNQYYTIKLSPVNYSVAKNEDIFQLIKYDIFLKLLIEEPDFEKVKFNFKDYAFFYLEENWKLLLYNLAKLGTEIKYPVTKPIFKILEKLRSKIRDNISKLDIDERSDIFSFQSEIINSVGSIYEFDFISVLLEQTLNQVLEKKKRIEGNPNMKSILLIEDLDRVDPAHVFRLLNIFSAHLDFGDGKPNKFNFDKIILVCDISNIRTIFHSKYGLNTDFSGYIDKFSSGEIFEFNIRKIINQNLIYIGQNFQFNADFDFTSYLLNDDFFRPSFTELLSRFISVYKLNFRKLVQMTKLEKKFPKKYISKNHGYNLLKDPILILFHVLNELIGGEFDVIEGIERLQAKEPNLTIMQGDVYYELVEALIYLFPYTNNTSGLGENRIRLNEIDHNFIFNIVDSRTNGKQAKIIRVTQRFSHRSDENLKSFKMDFWAFFEKGFRRYLEFKNF